MKFHKIHAFTKHNALKSGEKADIVMRNRYRSLPSNGPYLDYDVSDDSCHISYLELFFFRVVF